MSSTYLGRYGKGFLKMQKITTTLLVASVLALMACSTDDGKQVQTEMTVKQTVDVNAVKDAFASDGIEQDLIAKGKLKQSDLYNVGCSDQMGKPDLNVKIGDRTLEKRTGADQSAQWEIIAASTILHLSDSKHETFEEYVSLNLSQPALGEVLAKKLSYKTVCESYDTGTESGTKCQSDNENEDFLQYLKPEAQSFYLSQQANSINCSLENIEKESVVVKEVGLFTLASGKKIKARRFTTTEKGTVICKRGEVSQEMGLGEKKTILIRSNDVLPGVEKFFCGGAQILHASTLRMDGKVIDSYRQEKITPALRN